MFTFDPSSLMRQPGGNGSPVQLSGPGESVSREKRLPELELKSVAAAHADAAAAAAVAVIDDGGVSSELFPIGDDRQFDVQVQRALRNLVLDDHQIDPCPMRNNLDDVLKELDKCKTELTASKFQTRLFWKGKGVTAAATAASTAAGPLVAGVVALAGTGLDGYLSKTCDKIGDSFQITLQEQREKILEGLRGQYEMLGKGHIVSYIGALHGARGKLWPNKVEVCKGNVTKIVKIAQQILHNRGKIRQAICDKIPGVTRKEADQIIDPLMAASYVVYCRDLRSRIEGVLKDHPEPNISEILGQLELDLLKLKSALSTSQNEQLRALVPEIEHMSFLHPVSLKSEQAFLRVRDKQFLQMEAEIVSKEQLVDKLVGLQAQIDASLQKAETIRREMEGMIGKARETLTDAQKKIEADLNGKINTLHAEMRVASKQFEQMVAFMDRTKGEMQAVREKMEVQCKDVERRFATVKADLVTESTKLRTEMQHRHTLTSEVIAGLYEQIQLQNMAISRLQYAEVVSARAARAEGHPYPKVEHPVLTRQWTWMSAHHFPHGIPQEGAAGTQAPVGDADVKHAHARSAAAAGDAPAARPLSASRRPASARASSSKGKVHPKPPFVAVQRKPIHKIKQQLAPRPIVTQVDGIQPNRYGR